VRTRVTSHAVAALICGLNVCLAQEGTKTKITTEGVTVIQTEPATQTRIISKETTIAEPQGKTKPADTVATDTTPRKARVVVVPAVYSKEVRSKFERELNEKWSVTDAGVIENPGYTSYLVDALVNSHKLDVLEREDLKSPIKELDFGESDYADVAKVVKMGQMLNADYVVIPEIRYVSVLLEEKNVPYVGQKQNVVKGKFATNVRTVDVATSKIVASNISDVEKKTRFKDTEGPVSRQLKDFVATLYRDSAIQEAANVIDTAYPIKIVGVADNVCTVNRGKGAIELGEVLNVYRTGEIMIDPDTKESLGYHEARVGQVKVTEVNEKTAKAEIIEGAGKIEKLFICRREKAADPLKAVQPPAPKLD
jgi:curli biogenesis system outer membrane secretion channel CsgG